MTPLVTEKQNNEPASIRRVMPLSAKVFIIVGELFLLAIFVFPQFRNWLNNLLMFFF